MGPGDLRDLLCGLPLISDPRVLVGIEGMGDAGVYQLTDDLAMVQTVDFITPIVDDPYLFGKIAATNSISDVYAMGGRPVTAMNVVCFSTKVLPVSVLKEILRGGAEVMKEAGVALMGGHSVDDKELKYGLSVTGTVHPKKYVTNSGAKPGDKLVLTKPLGTGIMCTALKQGKVKDDAMAEVLGSMTTLNNHASELMMEAGVNACTDVTGFALIGHAWQMAQNSRVGMRITVDAVPLFPKVKEMAKAGMLPGAISRNKEFYSDKMENASRLSEDMMNVLYDPQTSGGLLIAVPGAKAEALLKSIQKAGQGRAAIIGEVAGPEGRIVLS